MERLIGTHYLINYMSQEDVQRVEEADEDEPSISID